MSKKGFTLIELLVYIAIFAVVAGLLTGILATFVRIQSRETASAAVSQELSFVQTTIQRLVRESVNIENPPGVASSTLILRMASSTLDPTIISSDANAIYLKQGSGAASTLTSARVKVSQFQAVKYENPGGHAIAQIDLSLTYNSQKIYQQITQNLKTSIGRVTAATFDDSLIPNADNAFSVGISPYRWKDAAFSGNLTVGGNVGIGTTSPQAKLHIGGTAGTDGIMFPDGALQTTAGNVLYNMIVVSALGPGTWTRPAGVRKIMVEAVGGGGGGGSNNINVSTGAGGGAGAYVKMLIDVSSINSISYSVGAGGVGAPAGQNQGSAGGATIFGAGGAYFTAAGGNGGYGGLNINGAWGGVASAGASAPSSILLVNGGESVGVTNSGYNSSGGAASFFGGGGRTQYNTAGANGRAYGSGGGGGYGKGGDGKDGVIIITEYK